MPQGTVHVETGMLRHRGDWLVLDRDLGGQWRLDVGRTAIPLIGRRVRVEGTRSGFDLLSVTRIEGA